MNKTIVIIPARANSKRLLNKNSKLLAGIPLFVHSINYAKQNEITKIVVSTNDVKIKEIALKNEVELIDRPTLLAGDFEPTVTALKHVLESIEESFETVIILQPTNPLRPKNLLKTALQKFKEGKYDSVMTVTRNEQKLGKILNNKFVPLNYKIGQRSQDLEPLYFENGLLYITKASLILKGKILGENNYPLIINHPFASVDIDTKEDFEHAEYLYKKYKDEL